MKNLIALSVLLVSLSLVVHAQNSKPQLLKEPANWAFERFELPPQFAPSIPYKGAEELRFSPGMFKKDSANYFTYAFVAELENTTAVSKNDIDNYLSLYFKGLCSSTAKDRKLIIDTSKINVSIEKKNGTPSNETIYNASLNTFGVFADGAPVKLNMEVKVLTNASAKKTYLLFIVSPQEKTNAVWKELYAIQKRFVVSE